MAEGQSAQRRADPPELVIRRYLDEHGGQMEAYVEHILETFGVDEDDLSAREPIGVALHKAGVEIDRDLTSLGVDEAVHLSTTAVPTVADNDRGKSDPPSRQRRKAIALALLALLAAAGLGIGGYLVGKSTGEDLDAARAAGLAAGKARGAARGSEQGYAAGYKQGRRKGYRATYGPAFKRAYQQAYEDEGLEVPARNEIESPK